MRKKPRSLDSRALSIRALARDDNSEFIFFSTDIVIRQVLVLSPRRLCRLFLLHRFGGGRCGYGSGRQPDLFADLKLDLGGDVFIVFQELLGILASLTDAFAFEAEPGA